MFRNTFEHRKSSVLGLVYLTTTVMIGCGGNDILITNCNDVPQLIQKVDPIYPRLARDAGIEGDVELTFTVDRFGTVKNVIVLRSDLEAFTYSAINAVSQYQYSPACRQGRPVDSQVTILIEFRL